MVWTKRANEGRRARNAEETSSESAPPSALEVAQECARSRSALPGLFAGQLEGRRTTPRNRLRGREAPRRLRAYGTFSRSGSAHDLSKKDGGRGCGERSGTKRHSRCHACRFRPPFREARCAVVLGPPLRRGFETDTTRDRTRSLRSRTVASMRASIALPLKHLVERHTGELSAARRARR